MPFTFFASYGMFHFFFFFNHFVLVGFFSLRSPMPPSLSNLPSYSSLRFFSISCYIPISRIFFFISFFINIRSSFLRKIFVSYYSFCVFLRIHQTNRSMDNQSHLPFILSLSLSISLTLYLSYPTLHLHSHTLLSIRRSFLSSCRRIPYLS